LAWWSAGLTVSKGWFPPVLWAVVATISRKEFLIRSLDTTLSHGGFSAFSGGIRDARRMSGRDQATGQPLAPPDYHPESWLGTLGYMAVLDHIGDTIKPRREKTLDMKGIRRALHYFAPELSKDDVWALYALRCSFAHDYGLVNRPTKQEAPNKNRRARLTHWFVVTDSHTRPLVAIPDPKWDGRFHKDQARNDSMRTWVNLRKFGERTEQMVKDLQARAAKGDLTISIRFENYQRRYAMGIRPDR
jgi:hypothetical protein